MKGCTDPKWIITAAQKLSKPFVSTKITARTELSDRGVFKTLSKIYDGVFLRI